ncbi:MAG: 16S rRNA (adenine(1518)-N(6)/adenine(1519)-N(6))-dimethyltransferase RsmA [Candidatus Nanopelagicales bacterium]
MTSLLGPREVRELADELEIHPRKALGQNFVVDPNTIRRIVRLADLPPGSHVLEVGPGLGSLTLGLLAAGHRVTAVELDPRLAERLPDTVDQRLPEASARLTVVCGDAAAIGSEVAVPDALVANLPYNVAVPVLLHCLATFPSLTRALVMVQREVADRLAAGPGSRIYGIPSVKAAWYGDVRMVGTVPPNVFWPVPRVDSGLVLLTAWEDAAAVHAGQTRTDVFALVDRLFAQRRKTVRHALAAAWGPVAADAALADAQIPPTARAEQLGPADFVRLVAAVAAQF